MTHRSYKIPRDVTAPGANGNTTTLYDTTESYADDLNERHPFSYYLLSLKTAAVGTLKGYASSDGGATWVQFVERYVAPSTTRRTTDVAIPIANHRDVKFTWVNGGSAQSTWYVGQSLVDTVPAEFSQGADAFDYISAGALTADVTGAALKVGPLREVMIMIQVPSISGAPNGLISLQGTMDGTTWVDIPGAFSELGSSSAAALPVTNRVCLWSGLNFELVRLKYTRTSGGTANTLSAQARCR